MKTPKTNKAIGEYIRKKREEMGLSLRAAAKRVDIDYAVLSRIESGTFRMSLPNAMTFSLSYGFNLGYLLKLRVRSPSGKMI